MLAVRYTAASAAEFALNPAKTLVGFGRAFGQVEQATHLQHPTLDVQLIALPELPGRNDEN